MPHSIRGDFIAIAARAPKKQQAKIVALSISTIVGLTVATNSMAPWCSTKSDSIRRPSFPRTSETKFLPTWEPPKSAGSIDTDVSKPGLDAAILNEPGKAQTSPVSQVTPQILVVPTFRSGDEESAAVDGFSGMVTVAFSAFDEFIPPHPRKGTKSGIRHGYIGLRKSPNGPRSGRGRAKIQNKSPNDMKREFVASAGNCLRSARKPRWIAAMKTLESDPVLSTWSLSALGDLQSAELEKRAEEVFSAASSGHRIVLLSVTRLVELVGERTLVLVDEPEAHLHPPLAASFVRALSDLLVSRNGVALLATHSPVIVQEVPANCVSLLFRSGDLVSIGRPDFETFAGSLGRITRSVFGVEVGESGFRNLILEVAKQSGSLEDLHVRFGERLGAEGRGLARAIWRSRRGD